MEIPLIITLFCLIVMSAFFSCSETAYTSLSHVRIERLANSKKSARIALKMVDNYDRLLNSVLIGNNIVNIAASTIA
ncbi:MAG: CNNM domain-containing protein, partial [Bacilli bacterium]|nr:CNNM domain-containing protein [Bacilli bacterium]MDY5745017.1 CNNM domain-containing protein [Bacilli bacterium]